MIHLHDFQPSKTKLEKGDIDDVVGRVPQVSRKAAVDGDGKCYSPRSFGNQK